MAQYILTNLASLLSKLINSRYALLICLGLMCIAVAGFDWSVSLAAFMNESSSQPTLHVSMESSKAAAALEKIRGPKWYDLPGVNGLELVSRAREPAHRARIPIVVLSATPIGAEARAAGADVFLQKPQDVTSLVDTISRLLGERGQENRSA